MNAPQPLKAKTVSLRNIAGQMVQQIPQLGTTLKGLVALIGTKPEKYRSIGLLLEENAARAPDSLAIRFEHQEYSYQRLNERVNQVAHFLQSKGIGQGDTVAVLLSNRPETLISVLATVKLGAVAAMLNTAQQDDVLLHSINLVEPKLLLVGDELFSALNTVDERLSDAQREQIYYWHDSKDAEAPKAHYQALEPLLKGLSIANPGTTQYIQMHQPCYYIFTSGTTGLPKASVMSHYRWHKSMAGMGLASMKLKSNDVLYVSLPLYHNNALTVSLAAVLGAGACIAIARKFSVSRFWDDIRHYDATGFCYIGELCRYLLNTPPSQHDQHHRVRVMVGNGLRPDIWMDFKRRFNIPHINEFYGASECNLVFTNALNLDQTAGICPLSYNIVAYDIENDLPIRDGRGFMQTIKKGGVGLLITEINDKQPFEGYTDADASNKKILRDVFKEGDCWFNTGDLVLNQGFKHVAFADRVGDTFRWKGENVATTEVESILMEFPEIEHAIVYGVEIPNTDGRAGMAAITLKHPQQDMDWSALTRHLQHKLPAYAIPIFIRIRAQEEVTGTFKYRKVTLKEEAYHLDKCQEPVWFLANKSECYQALTEALERDINQGSISV
ncbi:MAG: long-chain-acyl-CoA synthetase [Bacterioplanes sp.]|nr:long-chain-acyl-CoA synthetase [Bacterioplanes sp.]